MTDNNIVKMNTMTISFESDSDEILSPRDDSSNSNEKKLRKLTLENPSSLFLITSDNPLFGKKFIDTRGVQIDSSVVLPGKEAIALFFSCSYCPNNTNIIPLLVEVYRKSKEIFKPFEIVYVSFDEKKEKMMDDFQKNHGHWFAVDFDEPFRMGLKYMYDIVSLPQVIVIDSKGNLITWRGIQEMQSIGVNVLVTWFD